MKKIKTREDIKKVIEANPDTTFGFTSGAFDLLHAGHVGYLEKAKEKCQVLIVGVNSDASVKQYKGPSRPIVSEQHRIKLVAALGCVDFAFLFEERRNNVNIETLQPDFYIKGGDYKKSDLKSAHLMEKGDVVLIPVEHEISSSMIIDKIQKLPMFEQVGMDPRPAVFLDRDGVINKNIHFIHDPDQFEILPNVIEGLQEIQKTGHRLVVVTNQGGIGLGYYTEEDFFHVNSKMLKIFSKNNISIDKVYFCPHSHSVHCNCRKPKDGMLTRGEQELNIDMDRSFMVGDKETDIWAGQSAGVSTILIGDATTAADYSAKDLLEVAKIVNKHGQ